MCYIDLIFRCLSLLLSYRIEVYIAMNEPSWYAGWSNVNSAWSRAWYFLWGGNGYPNPNAAQYQIQQFVNTLLRNVHRGCCPKAGPGNQCGHCPASLDVLRISRAIVLSLHEFPSELLPISEELNTLCNWVYDEVTQQIMNNTNAIKGILPYEMSTLMMNDYNGLPPLDMWGDDIARVLQPISNHWSIRVKLLMHMGYRVALVDFDDVARFARKEVKAVCSDVSHLTCQTLEGEEDDIDDTCDSGKINNQPTSRKVSGQYKCGGCWRRWWGAAYMVINEATKEYDTLSEDYTFPECRRCSTNNKVELLQCKNNEQGCQPYNPLRQPHGNRNGRDDERDNNVNTTKTKRIGKNTIIRRVTIIDKAERMRQNWIQTSDRNVLIHSMKQALATKLLGPLASKIIVQNNINHAVKGSFHELMTITNMIEVLYRSKTVTKSDIEASMSDLLVSIPTHIGTPIYDYFGEMFRVFADMQALTLVWLAESTSKIKDDKCKYRIIKCALDSINDAYGIDAVHSCLSDVDESNALHALLGFDQLDELEDEFGYITETEYSTDSSSDDSSEESSDCSEESSIQSESEFSEERFREVSYAWRQ